MLINSLVALRNRGLMLRALSDIIQDHSSVLSDSQLRDFAHQLAAHRQQSLIHFDGERYLFKDVVQRIYARNGLLTDEGARLEAMLVTGAEPWYQGFLRPADVLLSASGDELIQKYDQFMDRVEIDHFRSLSQEA